MTPIVRLPDGQAEARDKLASTRKCTVNLWRNVAKFRDCFYRVAEHLVADQRARAEVLRVADKVDFQSWLSECFDEDFEFDARVHAAVAEDDKENVIPAVVLVKPPPRQDRYASIGSFGNSNADESLESLAELIEKKGREIRKGKARADAVGAAVVVPEQPKASSVASEDSSGNDGAAERFVDEIRYMNDVSRMSLEKTAQILEIYFSRRRLYSQASTDETMSEVATPDQQQLQQHAALSPPQEEVGEDGEADAEENADAPGGLRAASQRFSLPQMQALTAMSLEQTISDVTRMFER